MVDYGRRSRRPKRSRLSARRPGSSNIFLASKLTKYALFGFLGFLFLGVILFFWYSRDLPTPEKLSASNLSESTKILDRNGKVLYDIYGDQNRTYVKLPEISKYVREATIATEDADFYENDGFSVSGYLRAARDIFLYQRITGGSTITQQLVKNTLLTSEKTLPRKIKELMLAVQVDERYKKDDILELYLNVSPYGGTAVGIEAASERYFGKKAKDLNLVESAILAGLPQLPSYYSPYGPDPKAYIDRTEVVLKRMREEKYITRLQEKEAVESLPKIKFQSRAQADIKAPHFSLYVKEILVEQFGVETVEKDGLRVTTTLDYDLEKAAEDIVKEEVGNAKGLGVGNGASVVIDPENGEVLAMVGSKDFFATESATTKEKTGFQGQFNVITQAERQPGSSIKPITYATALERGYTASSLLMDTPTVFPNPGSKDYAPANYDGKFRGPVQVRFALGSSLNIPAVKMLAQVGIKNMMTTAHDMGISSFEPTTSNIRKFGLALTLGGGDVKPIELAASYTAFANGGYKVEPVTILKVEDRRGKKLYEYKKPSDRKRVLDEGVAFIISHILLDNNARLLTFGVNSYLNMRGRQVAVKTGTTDDKRDNWTIGWTPSVLVMTWVGNNDNSPMGNVASGVTGAAPIWRRIMLKALTERPSGDFKIPDNVIALEVDAFGGGLPVDGQAKRTEYFVKGTEPTGPSPIYKDDKIVLREDDPVSGDSTNRWQEGIDKWIAENKKDDPKYKPPEEKKEDLSAGEAGKKEEGSPTPTPSLSPTPMP